MFPVLFREGNVLALIGKSDGVARELPEFAFIELLSIGANFGLMTDEAEIVVAKLPVPEPVTSPVRVMVWLPVLVPVMASSLVLSAALILPAALVVAAEIEMAGALPPDETIGAVPVTVVTVPLPVPAPMVVLSVAASASSSMVKAKSVMG